MGLLESITSPHDLRDLTDAQLDALAAEIRDFLVRTCAITGGHLGPNLGVVELTLALHRTFDSPQDRIVFDTGHQAYVHKILTGRASGFDRLRQEGGLSGYPSQAESDHDVVENSHASTSLSYADGLAKAFAIRGEDRHVAAGLEAARKGWRTVRVELADQLPADAIEAAMTAYEREGTRLAAAARGVEVVAGALRGERWVPRL